MKLIVSLAFAAILALAAAQDEDLKAQQEEWAKETENSPCACINNQYKPYNEECKDPAVDEKLAAAIKETVEMLKEENEQKGNGEGGEGRGGNGCDKKCLGKACVFEKMGLLNADYSLNKEKMLGLPGCLSESDPIKSKITAVYNACLGASSKYSAAFVAEEMCILRNSAFCFTKRQIEMFRNFREGKGRQGGKE